MSYNTSHLLTVGHAKTIHDTLKSAITQPDAAGQIRIAKPQIVQGTYNASGSPSSSSSRIRTAGWIPVHSGDVLHFTAGTNAKEVLYGKYDKTKTYVSDSSWYGTGNYTIDFDGFIILVFRKSSSGAITPDNYDATCILDTKREQHSRLEMLTTTWESGSFGTGGVEIEQENRMRTGWVQVQPGVPLIIHTPKEGKAYIYEFDRNKTFIKAYGWINKGITEYHVAAAASFVRLAVGMDGDGTTCLTDLPAAVWMMQVDQRYEIAADVVDPMTVPGSVTDYTNYSVIMTSGHLMNDRRSTCFIPVKDRVAVFNFMAGYRGYLFQYDSAFGFIREDGYVVSGATAYGLDERCKYIRFAIMPNSGSDMSGFDSAANRLTIKFEAPTVRPVNDALLASGLISHRGADGAPENTIPAITEAIEQGFRHIEVDIRFTSDNVCVLLHDATIDRTSDGTGTISEMTYETALTYDFGSWKDAQYAGTKIPTLEETLAFAKQHNVALQLDIAGKSYTMANIAEMVRVIEKMNAWRLVEICTYNDYARPLLGMKRGINLTMGLNGLAKEKLADMPLLCTVFCYSTNQTGYSAETAAYFRALGALNQVWEIDSTSDAATYFGTGVDWMITNTLTPEDVQ